MDVPCEWTAEQVEEFKAEFARRMGDPSLRHELRLLPPGLYAGRATHIAGPEIQAGSRFRQRCAWCGVILADSVTHGPPMWAEGDLVRNDGDSWLVVGHQDGKPLPDDCCAAAEVGLANAPDTADPFADKAAQRGG